MNKGFLLTLAIISSVVAGAQNFSIKGTVKEISSEEGLPGSYVIIENSSFGTRTDGKGYFELKEIPAGDYELIISSPGFKNLKKSVVLDRDIILDVDLEENILDLPELVIETNSLSLGRVGKKKIPGAVDYISAAELKNYNYTNVNDVMKMIPGVNIQEEEGFGLRPNIGLRGSGLERSSKITLMEDGILAAPAPYSSPSAYYFPTMGRMNSVEVLKGSSQIRFGPFTTGGAVNLISTPIPADQAAKFQLTAGSFGYRNLHAFAGKSFDQVGFLVETFQYGAEGFKSLPGGQDTGFDKKDYQVKLRVNTKPQNEIYQSLGITLGQTAEVSNETYLGLTQADFEKDPYMRYASSQVDQMNADQTRISMQHYIEVAPWLNILTTGYRNEFARNWYKLQSLENGPGISSVLDDPITYQRAYNILRGQSNSDSVSLNVRANNRKYYSQGVQTVFDIEFVTGDWIHDIHISGRLHEDQEDRFQWEDGYAINDGTMKLVDKGAPGSQANRIETANALSSYVYYNLSYGRFSITPGIRHENVTIARENFGSSDLDRTGNDLNRRENSVSAWMPGAGVNYSLSETMNIFGGLHRGFAPPGSSPASLPEFSNNYEIGVRRTNTNLQGALVVFVNDYDQLLGRDNAAGGGVGTGNVFNAGTVLVNGIEFQASYDLLGERATSISLPVSVTYTYTSSKFTNAFEADFEEWGNVEKGDQLPYLPVSQFFISAGIEHQLFNLYLNARYQSDLRTAPGSGSIPADELIPSFLVADASFNVFLKKYFSVNISVNNMLNNEYAVASRPTGLRPGMPRAINLGFRMNY